MAVIEGAEEFLWSLGGNKLPERGFRLSEGESFSRQNGYSSG